MSPLSVILGIDPGLCSTGWAVISAPVGKNKPRALAYGVIKTKASDPLNTRLEEIHDGLAAVIERYQPTGAAIEGVYFGLNAKTALTLGQARGVAILATAQRGLALGEYPPATIKQTIVGTGQAEKEQITYMVRQLLQLDHDPQPDHCADALATALTHLTHIQMPTGVPKKELRT